MSEKEKEREEVAKQQPSETEGNALVPVYWLVGLLVTVVVLYLIGAQ
jgi:hypothetical protein